MWRNFRPREASSAVDARKFSFDARLPSARTDSGGGGEETKLGRGRIQDMHLAFFYTKVGQSKGNLLFKSVFDLKKNKK